jgi:3-polyprenyl-4-hydroxybenzoate decarboxylase
MAIQKPVSRNPWVWVPSLYVAEGIPYVMAMTVSVVLYNRMIGVGGGIQVHNIRAFPGSMGYVTQMTPSYEGHAKTALLAALSSENDMPMNGGGGHPRYDTSSR